MEERAKMIRILTMTKKVALVATTKKGGKAAGNKKGNNPNANKRCNHCSKKGHIEADCWKKHPDKIPEKVKAARKKQEEKKISTAAAAIESKGEDIILGAIKCNKIIFEPLDIAKGYHAISLKEENYVYFSDNEDSLNDKEDGENKDGGKDGGNSNDNIKIEKKNEIFQNATMQKKEEIKFDVSSALTCIVSTASPKT